MLMVSADAGNANPTLTAPASRIFLSMVVSLACLASPNARRALT
jgi:hypothetical protein